MSKTSRERCLLFRLLFPLSCLADTPLSAVQVGFVRFEMVQEIAHVQCLLGCQTSGCKWLRKLDLNLDSLLSSFEILSVSRIACSTTVGIEMAGLRETTLLFSSFSYILSLEKPLSVTLMGLRVTKRERSFERLRTSDSAGAVASQPRDREVEHRESEA